MLRRVDWQLVTDVSGQPTLENETMGCLETSVNNYYSTLRNTQEE